MNPPKFKIGDRVIYRDWAGAIKYTTVTANDGTKNGVRIYDLACGNWAYEDQLTKY